MIHTDHLSLNTEKWVLGLLWGWGVSYGKATRKSKVNRSCLVGLVNEGLSLNFLH